MTVPCAAKVLAINCPKRPNPMIPIVSGRERRAWSFSLRTAARRRERAASFALRCWILPAAGWIMLLLVSLLSVLSLEDDMLNVVLDEFLEGCCC